MINAIPETVTNFNVYDSSESNERLIGVGAEMELVTLEAMTETMSGAGIAGEFDAVTPGHFAPLDQEIPFNLLTGQALQLAQGDYANLTIRAAMQYNDASAGRLVKTGLRINMRGPVKSLKLGKVGMGKPGEASVTIGLIYILVTDEKNRVLLEVDKLNYKYVVNGVDKLAAVRELI